MTLSIEELRSRLPSLADGAYFNTGYSGPLPASTGKVMRERIDDEVLHPRSGADAFDEECRLALDAKRAFASLLDDVTVRDIALTDSTSHGLGLALAGLGLDPGDEIVTTDEEHSGLGAVLAAAVQGWGAKLRVVPFAPGGEALAGQIEKSLSSATRAVAISHISYVSGLAADIRAVTDRLPSEVPLIVDAAHTPGALQFSPPQSGAAAVAFPGQKWCLGPEGVGGLWVSPDWIDRIRPTAVSFRAMAEWVTPTAWTLEPGAAQYDGGTINKPIVAGLIESIRFLSEDVGLARAIELIQSQADKAREALAAIDGVKVLAPPGTLGGLVGFRVRRLESAEACEKEAARLWDAGVQLRRVEEPAGLRASVSWFNTDHEIELLAKMVAEGVER